MLSLEYCRRMKSIILVHGAWHGSWCWELVESRMSGNGFNVSSVDLPFTGLHDDAAFLSNVLDDTDGEVILVGHSYGGMVISNAAEGKNNVSHLVYLCAILLEDGMNMGAPSDPSQESKIKIGVDENLLSTVKPDAVIPAFYKDVDPQIARDAINLLRPFPIDSVNVGVGEAWREHPTTYVLCRNDDAINPQTQREMSALADTVVEWDCGHSPFFSHPDLVCDFLSQLAK